MHKWGPPQGSCTDSPPTGRRSPVTWTMKRLKKPEVWPLRVWLCARRQIVRGGEVSPCPRI
eukprot:6778660-Prymnesium_polylepis.1